jgi:hypothetical protein
VLIGCFAADLEEGAADEGDNRSDHFGHSGPHDKMDLGLVWLEEEIGLL